MILHLMVALIRTICFVLAGGLAVLTVSFAVDEIRETRAERCEQPQPVPGRHRFDGGELTQGLPSELTQEWTRGVA